MKVRKSTVIWQHEETGETITVAYLIVDRPEDRQRLNDHIAAHPEAQSPQADLDAYSDACERGVARLKAITSQEVDI